MPLKLSSRWDANNKREVDSCKSWLNKQANMSEGVKTVLSEMLSYAEENLCGAFAVANKNRYEIVNTIFNQGANVGRSPAAQKAFYALRIASEITSHFWSINDHVFIGLAV